jgi:hypothetical protein
VESSVVEMRCMGPLRRRQAGEYGKGGGSWGEPVPLRS